MNEIKVAPDDVLGYMTMKKYKNNETIVVMGASFNGVKDMVKYSRLLPVRWLYRAMIPSFWNSWFSRPLFSRMVIQE